MNQEPLHLTTRRTPENPDHHLWNNNGTWWLHFTLRSASGIVMRKRVSLQTRDRDAARRKRDRILAAIQSKSGGINA